MDVRVINDLVQQQSAFVDKLAAEVGKVIVGQKAMVERILIGLLTGGHVLLEGVPGLAKTLTVKTLADALSMRFQRIQFTPDLLPADIVGTVIYNQAKSEFVPEEGPDLRQPGARRRDQPRPGQGAVGAARGDAGAAGHHRRHDLPAARSVPGDGHAEPDRAGGHLPPARGAGRPLHADDQGRLPQQGGGARDHGPHDHAPAGCKAEPVAIPRAHRRRPLGDQPGLHRRQDQGLHRQPGARHARTQGATAWPSWRTSSTTGPARAPRST